MRPPLQLYKPTCDPCCEKQISVLSQQLLCCLRVCLVLVILRLFLLVFVVGTVVVILETTVSGALGFLGTEAGPPGGAWPLQLRTSSSVLCGDWYCRDPDLEDARAVRASAVENLSL